MYSIITSVCHWQFTVDWSYYIKYVAQKKATDYYTRYKLLNVKDKL